jgi:ubiquitin-conjugating enzyme E2 variant
MLPRHDEIGLLRRLFAACCIATATSLWAMHLARFVLLWPSVSWWSLALAAAGIAAADLASGLVHWTADTWGSESMPLVGRRLLRPFRVHHVNPDDFLTRRFVDANADVAAIVLPVLAAMFGIDREAAAGHAALAFLLGFTGVGLWTNQIHQWAHMPHPPRVVRWLQNCRLILSRQNHQRHHRPPHATDYCIATGWCNGVLNRADFFRRLERAITWATGCKPREDEGHFYDALAGNLPAPTAGESPP